MKVFVLDTQKQPLQPCHPARARQLLRKGKAAVYRRYPFTIILKREVTDIDNQPLRLKIDPGSKTTGLAIINDKTGDVVFAAELEHRGQQMKKIVIKLESNTHDNFVKLCALEKKTKANILETLMNSYSIQSSMIPRPVPGYSPSWARDGDTWQYPPHPA